MIIAIDFDGTICEHRFPEIGKILPFAKRTIATLKEQGHKIIIWTCRENISDGAYIDDMVEWLKKENILYDAINTNVSIGFSPKPKIYYDILIDDRDLFSPVPMDWQVIANQLRGRGILK
jgi:hypothetical protein